MFTRIVVVNAKPGKSHELTNTIHEKVLPSLRQQPGFLDVTVLTSDENPDRIVSLSFWKNKDDAERYHRENDDKIMGILSHLTDNAPKVSKFNVHTSTPHKIAAGKAA